VNRSVERQLTQQDEVGDQPALDDARRGEDAEGDWQIERGARLANVGGRQVHRHPVRRKLVAGIADGAAHAVTALADAGVGQADHREAWKAEPDVDLHMHGTGIDAKDSRSPQTGEH
jgi:hypothetical protein